MAVLTVTGARKLEADLGRAAATAVPKAQKVVAKAALNTKTRMRRSASASRIPEAKALSRTIDYSILGLTAKVGPRKGHAGSFAFLYYGNSKNGPVLKDPGDALKAEVEAFETNLARVAGLI